MSGRILPLCEVVRSQLRSGITINSVAQCIEELVLNSVDAGATCIAVRINFTIFKIQVVDNGHGIKEQDLQYLGIRHATSKCHSLEDLTTNLSHYGFRGEALASTVDISAIVDITTRPQDSTQTLTKLFTYGKMKLIGPAKSSRPSVGTTVTIQDFMYNMPVRRKVIREAIDVENVRRRLESFALMHPKISFSLRNDGSNSVILQTKKTSSQVSTFIQLFGNERAQGLAEVEHNIDQFTIRGYISTQPHINKSMQFVYVNKRLILKTKIHKMLNFLLSRCSIISSRMHPGSGGSGKPTSPVKGMRLYGIFFINIECPHSEYDICLDPSKTLVEFREWEKLLICIEEMFLKFIHEEDLVISLSDRYRKSGKWPEEEEEASAPGSAGGSLGISQLDIFKRQEGERSDGLSLKRSGTKGQASEGPAPKYGRSICTQDNLLAVHSLSVKRQRKNNESGKKTNNTGNELEKKGKKKKMGDGEEKDDDFRSEKRNNNGKSTVFSNSLDDFIFSPDKKSNKKHLDTNCNEKTVLNNSIDDFRGNKKHTSDEKTALGNFSDDFRGNKNRNHTNCDEIITQTAQSNSSDDFLSSPTKKNKSMDISPENNEKNTRNNLNNGDILSSPAKKKGSTKVYKNSWVIDKKRENDKEIRKKIEYDKEINGKKSENDREIKKDSENDREINRRSENDREINRRSENDKEITENDREMSRRSEHDRTINKNSEHDKTKDKCDKWGSSEHHNNITEDNESDITLFNSSQLNGQVNAELTMANEDCESIDRTYFDLERTKRTLDLDRTDFDLDRTDFDIERTALNKNTSTEFKRHSPRARVVSALEQFRRVVNREGEREEREGGREERENREGGREEREEGRGGRREGREEWRGERGERRGKTCERREDEEEIGRNISEKMNEYKGKFCALRELGNEKICDQNKIYNDRKLINQAISDEKIVRSSKNLSTLEEFVSFCKADAIRETPADAIRRTPSTPPPLRGSRRTIDFPDKPRDFDSTMETDIITQTLRQTPDTPSSPPHLDASMLDTPPASGRSLHTNSPTRNENMERERWRNEDILTLDFLSERSNKGTKITGKPSTLSQSLSEKLKKSQSQNNTRSILQKFQYKAKNNEQKTNMDQNKTSDRVQNHSKRSQNNDSDSSEMLENDTQKEDRDILDSSFRFQPVLKSKIGDDILDEAGSQENVDSDSPKFFHPVLTNKPQNIRLHNEIGCSTQKPGHSLGPENYRDVKERPIFRCSQHSETGPSFEAENYREVKNPPILHADTLSMPQKNQHYRNSSAGTSAESRERYGVNSALGNTVGRGNQWLREECFHGNGGHSEGHSNLSVPYLKGPYVQQRGVESERVGAASHTHSLGLNSEQERNRPNPPPPPPHSHSHPPHSLPLPHHSHPPPHHSHLPPPHHSHPPLIPPPHSHPPLLPPPHSPPLPHPYSHSNHLHHHNTQSYQRENHNQCSMHKSSGKSVETAPVKKFVSFSPSVLTPTQPFELGLQMGLDSSDIQASQGFTPRTPSSLDFIQQISHKNSSGNSRSFINFSEASNNIGNSQGFTPKTPSSLDFIQQISHKNSLGNGLGFTIFSETSDRVGNSRQTLHDATSGNGLGLSNISEASNRIGNSQGFTLQNLPETPENSQGFIAENIPDSFISGTQGFATENLNTESRTIHGNLVNRQATFYPSVSEGNPEMRAGDRTTPQAAKNLNGETLAPLLGNIRKGIHSLNGNEEEFHMVPNKNNTETYRILNETRNPQTIDGASVHNNNNHNNNNIDGDKETGLITNDSSDSSVPPRIHRINSEDPGEVIEILRQIENACKSKNAPGSSEEYERPAQNENLCKNISRVCNPLWTEDRSSVECEEMQSQTITDPHRITNKGTDEIKYSEINSTGSSSVNPFSESLHFSQLTLAGLEGPEGHSSQADTASIVGLEKVSSDPSQNSTNKNPEGGSSSLGALSEASQPLSSSYERAKRVSQLCEDGPPLPSSYERVKKGLQSCEISFHGKMINVGNKDSFQGPSSQSEGLLRGFSTTPSAQDKPLEKRTKESHARNGLHVADHMPGSDGEEKGGKTSEDYPESSLNGKISSRESGKSSQDFSEGLLHGKILSRVSGSNSEDFPDSLNSMDHKQLIQTVQEVEKQAYIQHRITESDQSNNMGENRGMERESENYGGGKKVESEIIERNRWESEGESRESVRGNWESDRQKESQESELQRRTSMESEIKGGISKEENKTQGINTENELGEGITVENKSIIEGQNGYSEGQSDHPARRWKEVIDSTGRKVYIDLQTGNTSYEPPPVMEIPEWSSSQCLGGPLLKVPLTHEPWFIPSGKGMRKREDFTLTHGFTELMSWRKIREARLNKEGSRENSNTVPGESSASIGTNDQNEGPAREVQEAIESYRKGAEPDSGLEYKGETARFSDVAQICQTWEAPDFTMDAELLNTGQQIDSAAFWRKDAAIKVYNAINEYRFTKDMLHTCKVLGQVDDKFIACSLLYPWPSVDNSPPRPTQLLVLFDQHAVDERIRLEDIIRDNYEEEEGRQRESEEDEGRKRGCEEDERRKGKGSENDERRKRGSEKDEKRKRGSGDEKRKGRGSEDDEEDRSVGRLRSAPMAPPMQLSLPRYEVRLMAAFPRVFTQRGLHFTQVDADTVSFSAIPSCLVAREASEVRLRRCQLAASIVESTVRDMCHTLQCTGGVVPAIPTPIANVLNSQACRGAVKFGDHLSLGECRELIRKLARCNMPFQCAHGRPSIMPLINMAHLPPPHTSNHNTKLKLWKLCDAM